MLSAIFACACASAVYAQCQRQQPQRFEIYGAQVYDVSTSLTWMRCSVGVVWNEKQGCSDSAPSLLNLEDAIAAATRKGEGWRVPELKELQSLVDRGCTSPALNAQVFPDVGDLGDGSPYWSVTAANMPMPMSYFVDFQDGSIDVHTRGFPLAVRLVRSGRPK